ncbi:MAG: hypothetical protein HY865_22660 [Chloroflexi bacterium]|nr:hypothetical protein [Chloroflexota bacterium]
MMVNSKYVIALAVLFIGIFLMPVVGYALGIVIIPALIFAAGYLVYSLLRTYKK